MAILLLIILPFCFWGEWFERIFDLKGAKVWLESLGAWAWIGGVLLLVSDLLLPIPGTVVMSALGLVYGWFWGGVISSLGSILSGVVAYGLCRFYGQGIALWLAGEEGLAKGRAVFASDKGGWIVVLSRWMPVLPEAIACLAGLSRMPWRRFLIALTCGCLPLGFVFAAIGHLGLDRPGLALSLSAGVPALIYAFSLLWMKMKRR